MTSIATAPPTSACHASRQAARKEIRNLRLIKTVSILCTTAVLTYLAVANVLYGQTSTERGDVKCAELSNAAMKIQKSKIVESKLVTSSAASNVQPADAARISPADVYALMCEHVNDRKPWTEPTPIPGNMNRAKVDKPFQITIK